MISGGSIFGFPLKTGGRITATPTVVTLNVYYIYISIYIED